ncbi:hypothetical protein JD969_20490 [Planctomycetota bacterium]|nr:hypothetical protein JD969_20490 [Planctomycetota bacterium]
MFHHSYIAALVLPTLLSTAFASSTNTNLLTNSEFYSDDCYFPQPDEYGIMFDGIEDCNLDYNIYNRWQLTRFDANSKIMPSFPALPRAEHSPGSGEFFAHTGTNQKAYLGQVIDFDPIKPTLDQTRLNQGGYLLHFGGSQRTVPHTWGSDSSLISLQQFDTTPIGYSHTANAGWNVSGDWAVHQNYTPLVADTTQLLYLFQADHHNIWSPTNYAYLDNAFMKIVEAPIYSFGSVSVPIQTTPLNPNATFTDYHLGTAFDYQPSNLNISNNATFTTNTFKIGHKDSTSPVDLFVNDSTFNTNALSTIEGAKTAIYLDNSTWNATGGIYTKQNRPGGMGYCDTDIKLTNNSTLNTTGATTLLTEFHSGLCIKLDNSTWNATGHIHSDLANDYPSWAGWTSHYINIENGSHFNINSANFFRALNLWIRNSQFTSTGNVNFNNANLAMNQQANWQSHAPVTFTNASASINNSTWNALDQITNTNSTINLNNSTLTSSKNIENKGTITLTNQSQLTAQSLSNESNLTLNKSSANITVFANTDTTSIANQSNLTLGYTVNSGSFTTNNSTLTHNDKLVNLGGNFTVNHDSTWNSNGGAYVLGGNILFSNATINTHAPFTIDSGILTVNQNTKWTAYDQISVGSATNQATFNIDNATLELRDNLYINYSSNLNLNNATIKTYLNFTEAITSDSAITLNNSTINGNTNLIAPLIQLNNGTIISDSSINIQSDIQGTGYIGLANIHGNLSLDATPSTLTLFGITMMNSSLITQLDILSETYHDIINFDLLSDFNGSTINIIFDPTFTPTQYAQFDIFNCENANLADSLATANIILPLNTSLDYNTGILTYTIPEPASVLLILSLTPLLLTRSCNRKNN